MGCHVAARGLFYGVFDGTSADAIGGLTTSRADALQCCAALSLCDGDAQHIYNHRAAIGARLAGLRQQIRDVDAARGSTLRYVADIVESRLAAVTRPR